MFLFKLEDRQEQEIGSAQTRIEKAYLVFPNLTSVTP